MIQRSNQIKNYLFNNVNTVQVYMNSVNYQKIYRHMDFTTLTVFELFIYLTVAVMLGKPFYLFTKCVQHICQFIS